MQAPLPLDGHAPPPPPREASTNVSNSTSRAQHAPPHRPPPLVFTFEPMRANAHGAFSFVTAPASGHLQDESDVLSLSDVLLSDGLASPWSAGGEEVPATATADAFGEDVAMNPASKFNSVYFEDDASSPPTLLWDDGDDSDDPSSEHTPSPTEYSVRSIDDFPVAAPQDGGLSARLSQILAAQLGRHSVSTNPWEDFASLCLDEPKTNRGRERSLPPLPEDSDDEEEDEEDEEEGSYEPPLSPTTVPRPPPPTPRPNAEAIRMRRAQAQVILVEVEKQLPLVSPDSTSPSPSSPTSPRLFRKISTSLRRRFTK